MTGLNRGGLVKLAALAVAEIGCELVLRCPTPEPDARTVSAWWNSVSRLHLAAGRLALWPMVAEVADRGKFANAGVSLLNRGIQWRFDYLDGGLIPHLEQQGSLDAYALIAALVLSLEGLHRVALSEPVDGRQFYDVLAGINYYRDEAQTDRFEDIASWPLPASIADRVKLDRRASVADYLALATSAPSSIGTPTPIELGVILFASMHLTTKLGKYRTWSGEHALLSARQDESARCALDWLGRQMPELVFPVVIEDIIGRSTRLRYA